MPPTRILHVTECHAGGVSRAIATAVKLLPDAQHHLLFRGEESPENVDSYESVNRLPAFMPAAVASVRKSVKQIQPDVIHAHSSWAGVFTRITSLGVPVVYQPHCYKFDDPQQSWFLRSAYKHAERVLAPRAAVTVVLSPHEERLARSLALGAQTQMLANIAQSSPDENSGDAGFEPGRDVIMIGRLSKQKDPWFYERVAEYVRERRPEIRFRWIGDGPKQVRLELERSGIEVTGWIRGGELAHELAKPAVYLHSARYEGFPISLLDAAAFLHPVIARAIPALEGLDIPSADSEHRISEMIDEAFSGGAVLDKAIAAAQGINNRMTAEVQRANLERIYAAASSATSV